MDHKGVVETGCRHPDARRRPAESPPDDAVGDGDEYGFGRHRHDAFVRIVVGLAEVGNFYRRHHH